MFNSILVLIITLGTLTVKAQMMGQNQWGSGQWGASQGCSYPQKTAQTFSQESEEVKELNAQIAETKKQIKAKKNEKQRLDRDLERIKEDISEVIAEDYSSFIFEHIENNRQCSEYQGPVSGEGQTPVHSFSQEQWASYCDVNKAGSVQTKVCDVRAFRTDDRKGSSGSQCKKSLSEYRKNYHQTQKLQGEVDRATRSLERLNEQLKQAKADAKEEQKERLASGGGQGSPAGGGRPNGTEGDICIECAKSGNGYSAGNSQSNWTGVAANLGVGLAAMYMGYKNNQMVTDANASIGMPTPYANSSWSYGLPYLQQGIYGAINNMSGQGSFGCGNNNNMAAMNGGAFGYPQNMMGGTMNMGTSMMGYGNMFGGLGSNMFGNNMYGSTMYGNNMYNSQYSNMYGNMYGTGSYALNGMSQSMQMYQQQQQALFNYRLQMLQSQNYSSWGSTGYAGGASSGVYSGYNGPGTPVYSTYGTSR